MYIKHIMCMTENKIIKICGTAGVRKNVEMFDTNSVWCSNHLRITIV